ncbi:MAG: N-6 DNA methylase [Pleurocapsa sp. SU_196_0]|nr:N-6 DNA methylase [Pleurocapsa sp. SU_196_0]
MTYGMFATRIQQAETDSSLGELSQYDPSYTERSFSRATPLLGIRGNAVLTQIFTYFGGANAHPDLIWALEEVAMVLDHANMESIKGELGKATGAGDPVLHFYETFLAAYDKAMREKRGVYYTPEPVVGFIVRSVDHLLKTRFNLKKGLADSSQTSDGVHRVQILDPATGTGTFLHNVINHIYSGFSSNQGMWNGYVKHHLLPRIHGFEFLIAPYTLAHLKLDFLLSRTGYTLERDERVRVYLTNTLEEPRAVDENFLPLAAALQREALEASGVKRDSPVMVVMGNPPYSGHSANKGQWIADLLRGVDSLSNHKTSSYFTVDGAPLGEANPKWLNDDYVKFIRFAQWRIDRTGAGVLAFVTNHGYLDNPTFRGMRESLLESFDELYLLDLHGNSRKKETALDGSKDENVFDIMQGVAIGFFVKLCRQSRKLNRSRWQARVHADLYGVREAFTGKGKDAMLTSGKYHWLEGHDLSSTVWNAIKPVSPFYLFSPQDVDIRNEYQKGWSVTDVFPVNVLGFQTHRDGLAVAFDKPELEKRIEDMRDSSVTDEELRKQFDLKDNSTWQMGNARAAIKKKSNWLHPIIECDYRPFDRRWCYFDEIVTDRPRRELVQHVAYSQNLTLNLVRQTKALEWKHILVSSKPAPAVFVEIKDGSSAFPLYLYPTTGGLALESQQRRANLEPSFITALTTACGLEYVPDGKGDLLATWGPEDALHYIYAILHSPVYRNRYAEFLKIDFPRIPMPNGLETFAALTRHGAELTALHLLDAELETMVTFPNAGLNVVDKPRYAPPTDDAPGKVFINDAQCFTGISPALWTHRVGGYQVLEKWLKDRKGRELSFEDINHYTQVCAALERTAAIMLEIDTVIGAAGGLPLH